MLSIRHRLLIWFSHPIAYTHIKASSCIPKIHTIYQLKVFLKKLYISTWRKITTVSIKPEVVQYINNFNSS